MPQRSIMAAVVRQAGGPFKLEPATLRGPGSDEIIVEVRRQACATPTTLCGIKVFRSHSRSCWVTRACESRRAPACRSGPVDD
jgi:hypothetical protein